MNISELKEGDKLEATDVLTCLDKGAVVEVMRDKDGELYVLCREGAHYLSSPAYDDNLIVGFKRV